MRRPHRRTGRIVVQPDTDARGSTDPGIDATPPAGTQIAPPEEPAARPSAPRMAPRGSTPPSSLIAPPIEVEGDLERAMTDLTTSGPRMRRGPTQPMAPEDDAEITIEPAKRAPNLSEPEISIEALEDAAGDDGRVVEVLKDSSSQKITISKPEPSEPEIVVEPLVAAESGPQPRPKRPSDVPD